MRIIILVGFLILTIITSIDAQTTIECGKNAAAQKTIGSIEAVACFNGPMPTGVAVSRDNRIFVNFPKWGDTVDFTVAELVNGNPVAYPDIKTNQASQDRPEAGFVSVQSVVVDSKNRLWVLDTGRIQWGPPKGSKLVGIDLNENKVFKSIPFPPDVCLPDTYLNDVRFDLRKGKEGVAYITDSSGSNPGIIVVDLASSKSRRRLTNHPSTKPLPNFVSLVEGSPLMERSAGREPKPLQVGADGIAISDDGKKLFYCPLSSWDFYSISTDALLDEKMTDDELGKLVKHEGSKVASDGLESDSSGNVYVTSYDHNAILKRSPNGAYDTIACDPKMLWPDTLALAADGYLYFTVNQLHRQSRFHHGKDLREKPYMLYRIRVDAQPVDLQ